MFETFKSPGIRKLDEITSPTSCTADSERQQDALRFTKILGEYFLVLYKRLGRRLQHWTPEGREKFGYMKIIGADQDQKKLEITCPGRNEGLVIEVKMLEVAPDCVVVNNLSPKPYLFSASLESTNKVVELFNKGKTDDDKMFEPEMGEFPRLPNGEMPAWVLQHFKSSAEDEPIHVGPPSEVPAGNGGAQTVANA
jgi:hypothetical protein